VSPKACLDDVEKRKFLTLSGLELRTLGRVARSSSYTDYAWSMVEEDERRGPKQSTTRAARAWKHGARLH
jgi:hypothetical protein